MLEGPYNLKIGDCVGRLKYSSIFNLMHAGIEGAENGLALVKLVRKESCRKAAKSCFLISHFARGRKNISVVPRVSVASRPLEDGVP